MIHFKKRKGDAAVPSLLIDLKDRFLETYQRPDLTLMEHLADRGYQGEDVDRIVALFASNTE